MANTHNISLNFHIQLASPQRHLFNRTHNVYFLPVVSLGSGLPCQSTGVRNKSSLEDLKTHVTQLMTVLRTEYPDSILFVTRKEYKNFQTPEIREFLTQQKTVYTRPFFPRPGDRLVRPMHADYAQQRSRCTFSQVGVASHYGQLLCNLNFKNEHLICGELKVNKLSLRSRESRKI